MTDFEVNPRMPAQFTTVSMPARFKKIVIRPCRGGDVEGPRRSNTQSATRTESEAGSVRNDRWRKNPVGIEKGRTGSRWLSSLKWDQEFESASLQQRVGRASSSDAPPSRPPRSAVFALNSRPGTRDVQVGAALRRRRARRFRPTGLERPCRGPLTFCKMKPWPPKNPAPMRRCQAIPNATDFSAHTKVSLSQISGATTVSRAAPRTEEEP
jgi:hypothetical protein